jgi:prepilin-type N-terminal cleavage/methylation domain-containing protein
MLKKERKAFTLVELVVVITILAILSTIWFISMLWYLLDTRNSKRISDLSNVFASMKTYKNQRWKYPIPVDYFSLTNGPTNAIAWQWKLWKNISLTTIDEIPLEPKLNIPYIYSITASRQEFQLAWTLEAEWWWDYWAIVIWNYNSVSQDLLPTLLVATSSSVDVTNSSDKNLFIFNDQNHNLPYSFISWSNPVSDWTNINVLLQNSIDSKNFSQNSDFETCQEIEEWLKEIWNWTYQVRDEFQILTDISCTF